MVKAGKTYQVQFSTEQLATIQGYQFTLAVDQARIEAIQGQLMPLENFGLQGVDRGQITTSWNVVEGKRLPLEKTTSLFTLEVLALKDGQLRDMLSLQERPTLIEAYDLTGNQMAVSLNFMEYQTPQVFELYQNEPNPFHNQTTIEYTLPADGEVSLILRDETGKQLKVMQQNGKMGRNQFQLEETSLPSGMIYYQIYSKFGTKAKKMLRLN